MTAVGAATDPALENYTNHEVESFCTFMLTLAPLEIKARLPDM